MSNVFDFIYEKSHLQELFNIAGQYIQSDEIIDRDTIKSHLLLELNKLKSDFEKIIPTDPEAYHTYGELNRILRGYKKE
jgi:hypothetical protein